MAAGDEAALVRTPALDSGLSQEAIDSDLSQEAIEGEVMAGVRRVRQVAKSFGAAQEAAASEWLESTFAGRGDGGPPLLETQLALFEECAVGDLVEEARCREFSEALERMCDAVGTASGPSSLSARIKISFAASRVRRAASHFGPEQRHSVEEWLNRAKAGDVQSPAELLERQVSLFGECLLNEDGTPSKCQDLAEAVDELNQTITKLAPSRQLMQHLFDEVSIQIGTVGAGEFGVDSFDVTTVSTQLLNLVNNGEFSPEKLKGYFFRACVSAAIHKAVGSLGVVLAATEGLGGVFPS